MKAENLSFQTTPGSAPEAFTSWRYKVVLTTLKRENPLLEFAWTLKNHCFFNGFQVFGWLAVPSNGLAFPNWIVLDLQLVDASGAEPGVV